MPLLVPFCFQTHPVFGLPTPVHLDCFLPAPPFQLHQVLQKKAHLGRINPIFLIQPPMLPLFWFLFLGSSFSGPPSCVSAGFFFCQFLFYNWLRFVIPWCRSVDLNLELGEANYSLLSCTKLRSFPNRLYGLLPPVPCPP